jgi:hypothetical protein
MLTSKYAISKSVLALTARRRLGLNPVTACVYLVRMVGPLLETRGSSSFLQIDSAVY